MTPLFLACILAVGLSLAIGFYDGRPLILDIRENRNAFKATRSLMKDTVLPDD